MPRKQTATPPQVSVRRFGWIPDRPDHRDFSYAAPVATLKALPPKVNLRPQCPPVYDQGHLEVARRTRLPEQLNSTVSNKISTTSRPPVCSSTTTNARWKAQSIPMRAERFRCRRTMLLQKTDTPCSPSVMMRRSAFSSSAIHGIRHGA